MTEPWIRVHANLAAKPVVWRAVDALKVTQHEAMGLLMEFWGSVAQHGTNGEIGHATDAQLEAWAGWRGKRGRFAAFVRNAHMDESGRVREWDEYAGKLEERRAKDRARKGGLPAEFQRNSSGIPAEPLRNSRGIPENLRTNSIPTRANEDEDVTRRKSSSSPSPVASASVAERHSLPDVLPTEADRTAYTAVLAAVPHPVAWAAEMGAALQGMHGITITPPQLGEALREYVANGHCGPGKTPGIRHFKAFMLRATLPGRGPPPLPSDAQLAADKQWAREQDEALARAANGVTSPGAQHHA